LPQVLSIGQNKIVFKRSQPLRSKPHFYAAKSSFDDFGLRLLLRKQKRSQPLRSKPHIMRRNRCKTISG